MEEQIKEQKEGMPEEQKITLTVREAAKLIGISEKSAYNKLIRQPGFPVVKIGKRLVILREAFIKWLEKNTGIAS